MEQSITQNQSESISNNSVTNATAQQSCGASGGGQPANQSLQQVQDFSQLWSLLAPYDYLVCLSIETTSDTSNFNINYKRSFLDNTLAQIKNRLQPSNEQTGNLQDIEEAIPITNMDDFIQNKHFPNIVQMNWCAYNLRKAVVEFDMSVHVKPSNMQKLNQETVQQTGVTQDELDKRGFTLQTAIQKFTDMVYNKIMCRNQSFQIVTQGDWVLQYQFSIEALQKQIRLGQHFQQFINILSLYYASVNFSQTNKNAPFIKSVPQILAALDLQEKNVPEKSKQMCQSLTRIVNRLVINMNQFKETSQRDSSKHRERSRSRSRERLEYSKQEAPANCRPTIQVIDCAAIIEETDLAQFFSGIPFKTFEFKEKEEGLKRTWTIELEDAEDMPKALALNGQLLKEDKIQVAQLLRTMSSSGMPHQPEDVVCLRMRGLPFSVRSQDILLFFSGFALDSQNIQVGKAADGRPTGQGAVLFENIDECKRAMIEKQGQHLGHRWIELYQMRYNEFQNFQETQQNNTQVQLNNYLTDANSDRALRLRGLPFSATLKDIVEFFHGYGITETDIVIDQKRGKPTGYALVFLKNSDDAKRARDELDRKHVGNRYVEVLFANQKH